MATLRKNTKADFEWEQRKGHHFPKNKENGAHSLGLLWQLKVIGRPDFPCGWWKVKDFRDDSSSLLEDTLLASLAWECAAPAGNGQVQTASRRQLSLSFAHLSGSHLLSSSPLWPPCAFTTPAAASGHLYVRARRKKHYKIRKEVKRRRWWPVWASRFTLQRIQEEASCISKSKDKIFLLSKAFWNLRPHPLETSILCTHNPGQSSSLATATQGTGQDGASQGSGAGQARQQEGQATGTRVGLSVLCTWRSVSLSQSRVCGGAGREQ